MKRSFSLLTLAAAFVATPLAHPQALVTASTPGLLQIGGAYVADFPDYTRHKFFGYGAYIDFDFSEHYGIEAEFKRASDTNNVPEHEQTFTIGGRYVRQYGNLLPYVKVEIGRGTLAYPPFPVPAPVTSPASISYTLAGAGAGLDYAISRRLSLRAALEYQRWFASTTSAAQSPNDINGLPRGLTPIFYTGGVAYRFGNGNILRQRYEK